MLSWILFLSKSILITFTLTSWFKLTTSVGLWMNLLVAIDYAIPIHD